MFGSPKHIYNPKIKQKHNFWGISVSSLHLLNWCSKFFFEKRIHNTFQIRGDKTQRQQKSLKNKVKFVDYTMKWIVVSYSESYFEKTKYILAKFCQFSCIQEY